MQKKVYIVLISLFLVLFSGVANSQDLGKIGYGSSDAVLPGKNQELFFMGFDTGMQTTLKERTLNEVLITNHVWDSSQLGAMRSANYLVSQGVVALIGFPTSHEALLVSKVAKENKMLGFFAGAGHADLAKMGSLIYTTGESMKYSVESTLGFIKKHFPSGRGVLIVNPYAVFSKNQEDTFVDLMKDSKNRNIEMVPMYLRSDLKLSSEDIKRLKNLKIDYLCLTPYADESVRLMEQMEREDLEFPLISNSSWTTGDIEFIRRFLTNRKSPVYSATLWLKGSSESKKFESVIRERYGKEPTSSPLKNPP
ncbi:MAG: hypothetical protein COV43_00030 [Deltaproteobacteria bacterium CG11_big_fil_rev_8_21_14_0_20_42_23]|nr:MAG: hypothetical protein COV43_00030 [Deltaproteobacteria bacterium CG11_big_fil_rev_8_21_14_0_20_42_23]PJC64853.1 MAG: hypothetical protein CO021_02110 [Deltaproteobacteria bacterium CG_4_9_14_0_2_um_filter_42_21]